MPNALLLTLAFPVQISPAEIILEVFCNSGFLMAAEG
jgi:hypothetical protein